jgi:hypothetical protein
MAHPRHEEVRQRCQYRCVYCGVSETAAGGELTVDHFRPVSAGGDDGEANLVYACFRCNLYKGDFFPNAEEIAQGRRILHPLLEDVSLYLREYEETGQLEPLTETGRFHIHLLRLNRPQLVDQRLTRRLRQYLLEDYQLLQTENEALRRRVLLLETDQEELNRWHDEAIPNSGGDPPE